jgi:hypothetical protein
LLITKNYIRNLDLYLDSSYHNHTLIFGATIGTIKDQILAKIGFSPDHAIGDSVLPSIVFGPVSRFNAEGKFKIHRNQPMETAYRQVEWMHKEWRGRNDTEDVYDITDVPYKRYPRTLLYPPSVELTIGKTASGNYAVLSPAVNLTPDNKEEVVHTINLVLEIFGSCEVFSESLEETINSPIRRLNWRILPPGEYPWPRLESEISQIIEQAKKGNQKVIVYRLKVINSYGPNFYAIGQAGFHGYIVFQFPAKGLFFLESIYYGNATYIFSDNWENLSKKTKAEILNNNLQKGRIIHRAGWQQKVHELLA